MGARRARRLILTCSWMIEVATFFGAVDTVFYPVRGVFRL